MSVLVFALLALSQAAGAQQAPADEDLERACQVSANEVRTALRSAEGKPASAPFKVGRCHIEKGDDGRVRLGFVGDPLIESR